MENFTSLLREFENSFKCSFHTCIPCKVIAVDNGRVDIQPVYQGVKIGVTRQDMLETGEYVQVDDYELPIISDCPIVMLINSNARITMPIEVGNTGLLMISERDITNWKNNTSTQLNSLRKFNINDGFFLPFINQAVTSLASDGIEINYKGKIIKITDSLVSITGNTKITGNLEVTGDLKIDGKATITGEATISGIAFSTHKHSYVSPTGPAITGAPQ